MILYGNLIQHFQDAETGSAAVVDPMTFGLKNVRLIKNIKKCHAGIYRVYGGFLRI